MPATVKNAPPDVARPAIQPNTVRHDDRIVAATIVDPRDSTDPQLVRTIVFVIAFLTLLGFGRDRMFRDPGTLWHTVVGEQMLASHEIVRTDAFSLTEFGKPWIAQQWLAECAMAILHRISGLDGLLLGAATLLAATFAMLGARLARGGLHGMLIALVLLLVAGGSSYHFMPRPHLVTIALTAWTFAVLVDVDAGRRRLRRLLILPAVFVVWTNCHGGALGGIATATLVLLGWITLPRQWIERPGELTEGMTALPTGVKTRRLCLAASPFVLPATMVLSAAAIVMNPFGFRLPAVWLDLLRSSVLPSLIIEHAPPRWTSPASLMLAALTICYLVILASSWRCGRRLTWLVPLLWIPLAMSRVRHGPLLAVTIPIAVADMLPLCPLLGDFVRRSRSADDGPSTTIEAWGRKPSDRPLTIPACVVLLALLVQNAGMHLPLIGAGWARLSPSYWPVAAVNELDRQDAAKPKRTFNDMLFGGYLIYRLPGTRVFIDDRCELYGDAGLGQYTEAMRNPELIEALADQNDLRYALVRSGTRMSQYLTQSNRWTPLHRDGTASLFRRVTPKSEPTPQGVGA